MARDDNVEIARSFYDAWNARDFDRGAALMHEDGEIIAVGSGERFAGPGGARQFSEMWASGFPDGRVEITSTIAEGDQVVVEFTGRGTHTGTLQSAAGSIPATGKEIRLEFCDVYELRDGKVRSLRTYFDSGSLLAQLGILGAQPAEAMT
jgi:steroid delta-isomerase-like uncharacterized protein